jgi:hypothetical protein
MPDTKLEQLIDAAADDLAADPHVVVNEDGTKTVTLDEPIDIDKAEITHVTFRKPRGKDWLETDKRDGDLAKGFTLAASLSGLPFSAFEKMDGGDALLCSRVASTMGKKSKTGGKP